MKKQEALEEEKPTLFEKPASEFLVETPTVSSPKEDESPYWAKVLVRNLKVQAERIDMDEFVLTRVELHFEALREELSSMDVLQEDWLLEKTYNQVPSFSGLAPSGLSEISRDIEDILLLLRLSEGLRTSQSWCARWFLVARRFFLYGGAKEFNPGSDEVDRIVDYATALEVTLVPEGEFLRSRFGQRAAVLCSTDPDEQKSVARLMKKLHDLRSTIVHGSVLGEGDKTWLKQNSLEVELRVRQVLVAAVWQSRPDIEGRTTFLQSVFDVTDEQRGEFALHMFKKIKTEDVRNVTAAEIAKFQAKTQRSRTKSKRGK